MTVPITAFFQMHIHDVITDEQAEIMRGDNEELKGRVNDLIGKQLMDKLKREGGSAVCLSDKDVDGSYAVLEGWDM